MARAEQSIRLVGLYLMCGMGAMAAFPSCKTIAPAVVEDAAREGSWYTYMPQYAPGFCLRTRHAMIWHDPQLDLGYWQGLHPSPPHRVVMEARGTTFILHRHYDWDGNSVGPTEPKDLLPSLRHDALYHALKEGAPIDRRAIDLAYRRDQKLAGGSYSRLNYWSLRAFGGFYNRRGKGDAPTLVIRMTSPETPPAPLEEEVYEDDPLGNLLPAKNAAGTP